MDFVILDELGYLPFAQSGGQLLFHLINRLVGEPVEQRGGHLWRRLRDHGTGNYSWRFKNRA